MTGTEWEREMNQQQLSGFSLRYLIALFKPDFHPLLLQKTQLYKKCKWTFDLTVHHLIGILEVPQTYNCCHQ